MFGKPMQGELLEGPAISDLRGQKDQAQLKQKTGPMHRAEQRKEGCGCFYIEHQIQRTARSINGVRVVLKGR